MKRKLVLLLGIRPDVIRCSLLIKILKDNLKDDFVFIWSGQHYSDNMKDIFFRELQVPYPDITFDIDTANDISTIASLSQNLNSYLQKNPTAAVVYLGDTNTVASSIACAANNIPIVHIEGCMRSYDWRMPEEKYRTLIDHLADVIYAYLDEYKNQGIAEGINKNKIIVTGNPIVDVLEEYFISGKIRLTSIEKSTLLNKFGLQEDNFWIMTCHRRENIENKDSLVRIIGLVSAIKEKVLFPAGYRTQKMLKEFSLILPKNVLLVDPIGYIALLELMKSSIGVITDSGTIVEEASVLGVVSIQMRKSTERPQVYDVGGSLKFDPSDDSYSKNFERILTAAKDRRGANWKHALGDGKASLTIATDLINRFRQNDFYGHSPDLGIPQVNRNFGFGLKNLGNSY